MSSAGILIIGNEILSGKVVDENSPYLCHELRELGVETIYLPDTLGVLDPDGVRVELIEMPGDPEQPLGEPL